MSVTVFERTEVKYRLHAQQYVAMVQALQGLMAPDAYDTTQVISIYFDTPEHQLIERSLEKPLYKEKLRLRSYGELSGDSRVFLEIKKKFDGIVYKRRVGMTYGAACAYIGGMPYEEALRRYPLSNEKQQQESLSASACQISREIDAFINRYDHLEASMGIACSRCAWTPLNKEEDPHLRITFDHNLLYQDLAGGAREWECVLDCDDVIMEIKDCGSFPLWLVKILDRIQARPTSFSKYGTAYMQTLNNSYKEARCA